MAYCFTDIVRRVESVLANREKTGRGLVGTTCSATMLDAPKPATFASADGNRTFSSYSVSQSISKSLLKFVSLHNIFNKNL
jgi:hypothetical protein